MPIHGWGHRWHGRDTGSIYPSHKQATSQLLYCFSIFHAYYVLCPYQILILLYDVICKYHEDWGNWWSLSHWRFQEATNGAVFWSHFTHSIIYFLYYMAFYWLLMYTRCIAVSINCCIPCPRTRITEFVSPYWCFVAHRAYIDSVCAIYPLDNFPLWS